MTTFVGERDSWYATVHGGQFHGRRLPVILTNHARNPDQSTIWPRYHDRGMVPFKPQCREYVKSLSNGLAILGQSGGGGWQDTETINLTPPNYWRVVRVSNVRLEDDGIHLDVAGNAETV